MDGLPGQGGNLICTAAHWRDCRCLDMSPCTVRMCVGASCLLSATCVHSFATRHCKIIEFEFKLPT
jgi:hypothetical protein